MSEAPKGPGAGGCVALIVFLAVEIAAGIGVFLLIQPPVQAVLRAIVPVREVEFADVSAIVLSFIGVFAMVYAIDRLCQRLTGHSVLDNLPFIP